MVDAVNVDTHVKAVASEALAKEVEAELQVKDPDHAVGMSVLGGVPPKGEDKDAKITDK